MLEGDVRRLCQDVKMLVRDVMLSLLDVSQKVLLRVLEGNLKGDVRTS